MQIYIYLSIECYSYFVTEKCLPNFIHNNKLMTKPSENPAMHGSG